MPVEVRCNPDGDGYRCAVSVADDSGSTNHTVSVSKADLERWARGRSVEQLVTDSFAFLLVREPKESILRDFKLSVITRYYPDFAGS